MQTSGKQFVEFWSWAAGKGLMNDNTAKTLAAAARQVIQVEEGWQDIDVSSVDADHLIVRFRNMRARDFKPESLGAYARRFRQALDLFLRYQRDPAAWRFQGHGARKSVLPAAVESQTPLAAADKLAVLEPPALVEYPFPLRAGCLVRFTLPSDLTSAEAERLATFLRTLALDAPVREAPTGL